MVRAFPRLFLGLGTLVLPCVVPGCIPDPDTDFENYGHRSAPYGEVGGGGSFSGTPVSEPVEGTYYASCLSQLAFGATDKVFNFYAKVKYTPDGPNGRLTMSLQSLKLNENPKGPPLKFEKAGTVGDEFKSKEPSAPNVINTKSTIEMDTVNGRPGFVIIPGEANPITGRPVEVENTKLTGRFAKEKNCAYLSGKVVVPVTLELEPSKNVCQIVKANEGDPTPIFKTADDFKADTCPP